MAWDSTEESNLVSRDEAKRKIIQLAKDKGINGVFKVFYKDALVANPDNLPEQVDMSLVRVSESLDQGGWAV